MTRVYLATGDRFSRLDDLEASDAPAWALEGSGAQCLAVDPGDADTVYVGCRGGGLLRTRDAGETWSQLALIERDVFSVALSAIDGAVYAGTSPAGCSAAATAAPPSRS